MFSPFGLVGYLANRNSMTDEQVKESDDALTPEGKKKIIDECMRTQGHNVPLPSESKD
ncbi:MAG: hypothetical protein P4M13_05860 [Alphaproteobacteria bacterium]|nr:hypothetical protein [Alphaproteobacteria bacterium]